MRQRTDKLWANVQSPHPFMNLHTFEQNTHFTYPRTIRPTYWTPAYGARHLWSVFFSGSTIPRFPPPYLSCCRPNPRTGSSCSCSRRFLREISETMSQKHRGWPVFSAKTPIRASSTFHRRHRHAYATATVGEEIYCCAGIRRREEDLRHHPRRWWIPLRRRSCHRRRRVPFLRWSVRGASIFYDGSGGRRRHRSRSASRGDLCCAHCAGCCCWRRRLVVSSKARSRRREPRSRELQGQPSIAETRKR